MSKSHLKFSLILVHFMLTIYILTQSVQTNLIESVQPIPEQSVQHFKEKCLQ